MIEKSDGDETVIWTRRGLAGKGWHRLRIPVRSSISPLRIEIRANASGANAFIQLTNTKLADKDGFELFCDAVDETAIVQERLIAIQQITTEKVGQIITCNRNPGFCAWMSWTGGYLIRQFLIILLKKRRHFEIHQGLDACS